MADCFNNRIQLFPPGALNGITVAGSTSLSPTITLNRPSGVLLDADKYLFIVEIYGNRVVGQGPNGFRCLVGCSGVSGSTARQLYSPRILRFDIYGNIFVTDSANNRVQKFLLISNSCSECINLRSLSCISFLDHTATNEVLTSTMSTGTKLFKCMIVHFTELF